MIFRDRVKYVALVGGLAFTTFLIVQQFGGFCGLMLLTTSTIRAIGAEIWVMDENGRQVNEVIPLRDIEVQRVRSVPGVAWAVPLYCGVVEARLQNGSTLRLQLVGLDSSTLTGHPEHILEGSLQSLWQPDAVILDQVGVEIFAKKGVELRTGTTFEVNDRHFRVVGLCHTARSFLGNPYAFTTYDRAMDALPGQRKRLSFVLVKAASGENPSEVARRINSLPGLRAMTCEEFSRSTMEWFFQNTGIPIAFGVVVFMGLIVGLAVTGLIFLMFVNDNLRYLAAMKAMGAGFPALAAMVGFQAFVAGAVGYGLGLGLAALYAAVVVPREVPAFFLPWQVPMVVAGLVAAVCIAAALASLWRLAKLEAGMVFK
jgi:putative ABC transport system permease protein